MPIYPSNRLTFQCITDPCNPIQLIWLDFLAVRLHQHFPLPLFPIGSIMRQQKISFNWSSSLSWKKDYFEKLVNFVKTLFWPFKDTIFIYSILISDKIKFAKNVHATLRSIKKSLDFQLFELQWCIGIECDQQCAIVLNISSINLSFYKREWIVYFTEY